MLMIIVTIVATGQVTNVQPLDAYMPILDEFEGWCKNLTGNGYAHSRVTLWDTDTNMTHGSREVNVPPRREAMTEEIRTWIRDNCREELNADKKIQAIKKTREEFQPSNGFNLLGLKQAKEHVEAVLTNWRYVGACGEEDCTYC